MGFAGSRFGGSGGGCFVKMSSRFRGGRGFGHRLRRNRRCGQAKEGRGQRYKHELRKSANHYFGFHVARGRRQSSGRDSKPGEQPDLFSLPNSGHIVKILTKLL